VKPRSAIGTAYLAAKLRLLLCGSILAAIFSFGVYLSNGRTDRSGDTVPASLIPVTVLLHGTTMLDSFAEEEHRRFANPYWLKETPYGAASRYPLASGILSIPIYAVPVLLQQWRKPPLSIDEWRDFAVGLLQRWRRPFSQRRRSACSGRSASLSAFAHGWLLLSPSFLPSAARTSRSPLKVYTSTALAASHLLCAIRAFLALQSRRKTAALFVGLFLALAVAIRINNLLLAVPIGVAVLFQQPRLWQLLLVAPTLVAVLLVGYNETVFGSFLGGGQRETGNLAVANIPSGLLGSFFSPARGLFLYFPAALLALIVVSQRAGSLWHDPLFFALGLSILLVTLLNSSFKIWYGGHSFGPRYFTEVQAPILILLGVSLETSGLRSGVVAACLALIIPYSVFVQTMGTFNDATMVWNAFPTNVDQDRSRLWDWSDNPIFRGLRVKSR
jgi:hypothetical protein